MKILCVADQIDPLVYSPNICSRYANVDLLVSAGDLPLRYYGYIVSMLNKQLYFIFGNHDLKHLKDFRSEDVCLDASAKEASGGRYLGGKVVYDRDHKLIIAGLGGCKRYNKGRNQFTEWQMFLNLLPLLPRLLFNRIFRGRWLDILLTHAPPAGIHDRPDPCHQGFKVFLWLLRTFKPRYMLHGHVHLLHINEPRVSHYYQTEVINVFGSYVLSCGQPQKPAQQRSKSASSPL